MSQTAERLIDKLKIAIFNVYDQADAKAIGAQLRLMALADGSEKRLKLTPREGYRFEPEGGRE